MSTDLADILRGKPIALVDLVGHVKVTWDHSNGNQNIRIQRPTEALMDSCGHFPATGLAISSKLELNFKASMRERISLKGDQTLGMDSENLKKRHVGPLWYPKSAVFVSIDTQNHCFSYLLSYYLLLPSILQVHQRTLT